MPDLKKAILYLVLFLLLLGPVVLFKTFLPDKASAFTIFGYVLGDDDENDDGEDAENKGQDEDKNGEEDKEDKCDD